MVRHPLLLSYTCYSISTSCSVVLYVYLLYSTLQNVIEETAHQEDSELKVVKFAQTPIMSTYLLAFVVGEFDHVEAQDKDGVLVRVYTPLQKSEQGKFALEVEQRSNKHFPAVDITAQYMIITAVLWPFRSWLA